MSVPPFRLDPHVFLGRVATGTKMTLRAANPSGELWRQEWVKREDGYWCFRIGPIGGNDGPLTYEQAYSKVIDTMKVLCRMDDEEKAIEARWKAKGMMRP